MKREMEKMLAVFMFILISLSDPLPTLSSYVDRSESQVSPLTPNSKFPETKGTIAPFRNLKRLNNGTSTSDWLSNQDHSSSSFRQNSKNTKVGSIAARDSGNILKQTAASSVFPHVQNTYLGKRLDKQSPIGENTLPSSTLSQLNEISNIYPDDHPSRLVLNLDRAYTPMEIAEYIFVTGDERGFTQGVLEMMEDGQIMISKDDVILFLEAVQKELANLRGKERDHDGKDII